MPAPSATSATSAPSVVSAAPVDASSESAVNPFALLMAPAQVMAAAARRGLVPLDRYDPFEREARQAHPGARRRGRPLGSGKHQRAARAAAADAAQAQAGAAAEDEAQVS